MYNTMARILIVDDDSVLRRLFGKRLEHIGYEVHYASNGVNGLITAQEVMPHIILLDYQMREMTGDEMLIKLRESFWGHDIPVIMMSATRSITFLPNIELATDILYKPVIARELIKSIENILSGALKADTKDSLDNATLGLHSVGKRAG